MVVILNVTEGGVKDLLYFLLRIGAAPLNQYQCCEFLTQHTSGAWMIRKILLVCALAVLAAAALAESAPKLSLKELGGQTQKLSALRGKIVVLNFWATWCEPCQDELPRLSKLSQAYGGKNVQFVAVSIDEARNRDKIEPLLHRLNVDLDVWTGADLDTLEKFGLGNVVPGTMVIDEKGQVVTRVMGEARDQDVRTPLDWLLQGRIGPAPQPLLKRY
jgi:thiol-disulfide isomerase/thioredoxin